MCSVKIYEVKLFSFFVKKMKKRSQTIIESVQEQEKNVLQGLEVYMKLFQIQNAQ